MASTALQIYLDDHLALMTAEAALAKRVAEEHDPSELSLYLEIYRTEVDRQHSFIAKMIQLAGYEPSMLKQAVGWVAEKIGRLKPNDTEDNNRGLTKVVEIEALIHAANSRVLLWETIAALPVAPSHEPTLNFEVLAENTREQIFTLREFLTEARSVAFAPAV